MDIFNVLTETLNTLSSENILDTASLLSDSWKSRAKMCKIDLRNCIKRKEKVIINLLEDDSDCSKEVEELDRMNNMISEIDEILSHYNREPLPSSAVEKISECELLAYKLIMNTKVRNTLLEEIHEEERKLEIMDDLIDKIDRMWDNNDSEEDIKEEIHKVFHEIYPNHSIDRLVENFFVFATQDKNVRVNLTDEQINSLPREKYNSPNEETCGTCLEMFSNGEECMILHGTHRFHPNCIIPWLKMSVCCPTCRHDLRE